MHKKSETTFPIHTHIYKLLNILKLIYMIYTFFKMQTNMRGASKTTFVRHIFSTVMKRIHNYNRAECTQVYLAVHLLTHRPKSCGNTTRPHQTQLELIKCV